MVWPVSWLQPSDDQQQVLFWDAAGGLTEVDLWTPVLVATPALLADAYHH